MLKCTIIKEGQKCPLMGKGGCTFPGGECLPVVEACGGCQKAKKHPNGTRPNEEFCDTWPKPAVRWGVGRICRNSDRIVQKVEKKKQKTMTQKESMKIAKGKARSK